MTDVAPDSWRTERLRAIPRTDSLLAETRFVEATQRLGVDLVKNAIIAAQQAARDGVIAPTEVGDAAAASLPASATTLVPVINATGVVVHTNLGRAPLSPAAIDAVVRAAGFVDIEWDRSDGTRSRRGAGMLAALAARVPDAESVHVVNNGAAAIALAATALAAGKEIVVSRGELVEIGDGFRLPDLLVSTGARIREVGMTNRTTLADYRDALGPETGFVLKVHPSNFVVTGFTSRVSIAELASLDATLVVDIGSGLLQTNRFLPDEPDAATALRDGADLVTASGDKLLGGPQAGLLLGRMAIIERLRRHPLARALRVDKLTIAAMEATLRGPIDPTSRAICAPSDELLSRAEAMAKQLIAEDVACEVVASASVIGGGGAPGVELPSWAIALPADVGKRLRLAEPCVASRIERDLCLVDLRAVPPERDEELREAIAFACRTE